MSHWSPNWFEMFVMKSCIKVFGTQRNVGMANVQKSNVGKTNIVTTKVRTTNIGTKLQTSERQTKKRQTLERQMTECHTSERTTPKQQTFEATNIGTKKRRKWQMYRSSQPSGMNWWNPVRNSDVALQNLFVLIVLSTLWRWNKIKGKLNWAKLNKIIKKQTIVCWIPHKVFESCKWL